MGSESKVGFDKINEEILQSNCKQLIKSKVFLGDFKEKRYNDNLRDYRDLIVIDSQAESEIVQDLETIRSSLNEYCPYGQKLLKRSLFFGYTEAPADLSVHLMIKTSKNVCLWTELESNADGNVVPFGKYWFQVRTIKFKDNEILVKLKVLRPVQDTDRKRTFSDRVKDATKLEGSETADDDLLIQLKAVFGLWKRELSESLVNFLKSINRQTVAESFRFFSLLIVSLIAGLISSVKYIGIFTIKFMEQVNWFIHVITPAFLAIVDMFSKIIGGFYILLSMIWKDSVRPRAPPPQEAIVYHKQRQRYQITYRTESFPDST